MDEGGEDTLMPKFFQGNRVIIAMDAEVVRDARGEHGVIENVFPGPILEGTPNLEGELQQHLYQVWLDSNREIAAPESELSIEIG